MQTACLQCRESVPSRQRGPGLWCGQHQLSEPPSLLQRASAELAELPGQPGVPALPCAASACCPQPQLPRPGPVNNVMCVPAFYTNKVLVKQDKAGGICTARGVQCIKAFKIKLCGGSAQPSVEIDWLCSNGCTYLLLLYCVVTALHCSCMQSGPDMPVSLQAMRMTFGHLKALGRATL